MAATAATAATAAERLATVQESLQRLETDRAAALEQQAAAQADFDALDAQLAELYRRADMDGANVADDLAADLAAGKTQRADAAQRAQDAGLAANDLGRRLASVRAVLPTLERAAVEEELAAAVSEGAAAALRYRAAVQEYLAAAVAFQAVLTRCAGLSDNISREGRQPAHRLAAHLIENRDVDHVLYLARAGGDMDAIAAAAAQLFDRWRI